jgi:hypothetical protein
LINFSLPLIDGNFNYLSKKLIPINSSIKEREKENTHEELKKRIHEFVRNNREKVIEF